MSSDILVLSDGEQRLERILSDTRADLCPSNRVRANLVTAVRHLAMLTGDIELAAACDKTIATMPVRPDAHELGASAPVSEYASNLPLLMEECFCAGYAHALGPRHDRDYAEASGKKFARTACVVYDVPVNPCLHLGT